MVPWVYPAPPVGPPLHTFFSEAGERDFFGLLGAYQWVYPVQLIFCQFFLTFGLEPLEG